MSKRVLLGVGAPYLVLDGGTALSGAPPITLARPPMAMGPPPADRMGLYEGTCATQEQWRLSYYHRDEEGYYRRRHAACSLTIGAESIIAHLGTPAGVPMYFNHMGWWSGSLGRLMKAEAKSAKLVGEMAINNLDLLSWVPGGLVSIERGLNAGLSIGFLPLQPPTITMKAGTPDDPDMIKYGKIHLKEVSLTPNPALPGAGITKTLSMGDENGADDPAQ